MIDKVLYKICLHNSLRINLYYLSMTSQIKESGNINSNRVIYGFNTPEGFISFQ